eukprot:scaffold8017_cov21-Tisochrysis_lutea.AAC.3
MVPVMQCLYDVETHAVCPTCRYLDQLFVDAKQRQTGGGASGSGSGSGASNKPTDRLSGKSCIVLREEQLSGRSRIVLGEEQPYYEYLPEVLSNYCRWADHSKCGMFKGA